MKPKVTVICITYNQDKYIAETLDGFVMQITNFPIEVLVHDDASTDNTASVLKQYAKKYPKIIKPIYETENQYSKGPYDFINDLMLSATGDYIAWCEGDDYWTDANKLQLQVDFLEKNPDFSLCFHPVKVVFEDQSEKPYIFPTDFKKKSQFTVKELLRVNFIQTNSVVYRKQDYNNMPNDIMPHDWFLSLYHAQFGKIGFVDRVMSVYRRHTGGVWWSSRESKERFWKRYALAHLGMYSEIMKIYGKNKRYKAIVNEHIFEVFKALGEISDRGALLEVAIQRYPYAASLAFKNLQKELKQAQTNLGMTEAELPILKHKIEEKELTITNREHELKLIKASKLWKVRDGIEKLKGKK